MSAPISILAMGARTPVGRSAETSAAAVRAGISRIQLVPLPGTAEGAMLALDADLQGFELDAADRMIHCGRAALLELLGCLPGHAHGSSPAIPVLMGLPEPRPGCEAEDVARVCAALAGVPGPARLQLEPMPQGHAAAIAAIRQAHEHLQRREVPLVIIGGVDSYITEDTLLWLEETGRRMSPAVRAGFVPGEGAAFLALCTTSFARAKGLAPLAEISAVACVHETPSDDDEPELGEALMAAIVRAVAQPDGSEEFVDEIYCDINGQRHRSEEWGFAALRLGRALRDASAYHSAAASWGDVGAAAGALNLILCVQAWRLGYAKGQRALVWGSSEAGLRAAALLARAAIERE